MAKYTEEKISSLVNKIGNNQKIVNKFVFVELIRNKSNNSVRVVLKSLLTGVLKTMNLRHVILKKRVFSYDIYTPVIKLEKEINDLGKRDKNKYKRFKFISAKEFVYGSGKRMIVVANIESGELKTSSLSKLRLGRNPFYKRSLQSWLGEIKDRVNNLGRHKKWSIGEKYVFIELKCRTKRDDFRVIIENLLSKDKRTVNFYNLVVGRNPFRKSHYLNPEIVKQEVNNWGKEKNEKERYEFVSFLPKKNHLLRIIVRSLFNNDCIEVYYDNLRVGHNPFTREFNFDEKERIHPDFLKILNKNKIKIWSHEKRINSSQPDFICITKKGLFFIVELKSSRKRWSRSELKKQKKKYYNLGKKIFKNNFLEVFIVSDTGKYGQSFVEFNNVLINLNE